MFRAPSLRGLSAGRAGTLPWVPAERLGVCSLGGMHELLAQALGYYLLDRSWI